MAKKIKKLPQKKIINLPATVVATNYIDPKTKKALPDQGRQLFNHYPVPDGCPACHTPMIHFASGHQLAGTENLQISNCPNPECGIGLEFVIGKMVGNEFFAADLSFVQPDGDIMKAFKAGGFVFTIPKHTNQA